MRLAGLTLETVYFDDYLSFLSEVLELDLIELTDISMRFDLSGTWLEIKSTPSCHQSATAIEFILSEDEYQALAQKMSFFYYRKESSRFILLNEGESTYLLSDPDGRVWRFSTPSPLVLPHMNNNSSHVRIF